MNGMPVTPTTACSMLHAICSYSYVHNCSCWACGKYLCEGMQENDKTHTSLVSSS
ncbi:unnamed protein product, partial [Ceratitis capitata]